MEKIKRMLQGIKTENLSKLLRMAKIKTSVTTKEKKIELLIKIYDTENLKNIYYNVLNSYERDLIKVVAESSNLQRYDEVKEIYYKYHKKSDQEYGIKLYDEKSPINLFTLFSYKFYIDDCILEKLNIFIPKMSDKIGENDIKSENEKDDDNCLFICRENTRDFDKVIQYLNVNKLSLTPKKSLLNHKSYNIMNDLLNIKEIYSCKEEDVKGIENTYILNGLFKILEIANLIYIENGKYILTNEYKDYLNLSDENKIKYLYEKYLESSLNETSDILSENLVKKMKNVNLSGARKIITNRIKSFPVNKWVDYKKFEKIFRMYNGYFLRKYTGDIILSKHRYYIETLSHSELEEKYLKKVILKYLLTLGMVDVKYEVQHSPDYDSYYYKYYTDINIKWIRLNKMGAYVLGLIDKYEDLNYNRNDLMLDFFVTEDFDIVVEDTKNRLKHEIYFDKYFKKKKIKQSIIYKLDFEGIIKALDDGETVLQITDYLTQYSKNTIPINVMEKLKYWEDASKRITIEQVYVIKSDEKIINGIRKDKDFQKYIKEEISDAIILKEEKLTKVKEYFKNEGFYVKK